MADLHTSWHSWKNSRDNGMNELQDVLQVVLAPIAEEEPELEDITKKIQQKLWKASDKFAKDNRVISGGSAGGTMAACHAQARALIDEFVEWTMGALTNGPCWDKPWLAKVDFLPVLLVLVHHTFVSGPVFARTFGPTVLKAVEEALFKWQEEDRILKVMWEALEPAGIPEPHRKKIYNAIHKGYDAAHYQAPYGSDFAGNMHPESSPLSVLQDFVKGWIFEFICRSSELLESGMMLTTKEAKAAVLVGLFKTLADPTSFNCLPYDITSVLTLSQITDQWAGFIDQAVAEAIDAHEAWLTSPAAKRRKR